MFVLKSFYFDSLQHNGNFWPPFGKKALFGIGTGSLIKRTQIHYKKSLAVRCSGCWELESVSANQKPVWSSLYTEQHETHTIDFEYFLSANFLWSPSSNWIEVMEPIRNKCDHHWRHICPNNINVCCKPRVLHRYKISWEKGRDLTQSYDKSQCTNRNVKRAKWQHKQRQKNSITQRLRTDLWRSVGVTTATQLEWLTWFMGPTFPLTATVV